MGRFFGITGTPGTGKKTLAPPVAEILGLPCVSLNDLVPTSKKRSGSAEVDPAGLRRRLLSRGGGRCLAYGHLFPDVLERRDVERVVVLRCDPAVLKRRLLSRRYSAGKVTMNVEAELIGLISSACVSKYGGGRVVEFDTTSRNVASSAKGVAGLLKAPYPIAPQIDWLDSYASAVKFRSLFSAARRESALT